MELGLPTQARSAFVCFVFLLITNILVSFKEMPPPTVNPHGQVRLTYCILSTRDECHPHFLNRESPGISGTKGCFLSYEDGGLMRLRGAPRREMISK